MHLAAAVDIDPERAKAFCEKHQIPKAYTDMAQMLKEVRPDLVQITTPPQPHAKLSIQCMEGGADVLCEKPLCGSLKELDQIQQVEKKTGKFCASVFQMRYGHKTAELKTAIAQGKLGKPLVSLCQTMWYRDHAYYEVPWRGKWSTELGGPTMGHGIHAMDHWLYLLGDWSEVRSMVGTLDRKIEVEDISMAMVKFENGSFGSVINTILCPREETYLRFDFQKATVELKHLYGYNEKDWTFTSAPKQSGEHLESLKKLQNSDAFSSHGSQLSVIVDDILQRRQPITGGSEARRTIEFLTAIYKSAFTNQTVLRNSIQQDDPFYSSMHGNRGAKKS
jgi:predicted dehydrogenase